MEALFDIYDGSNADYKFVMTLPASQAADYCRCHKDHWCVPLGTDPVPF